MLAVFFPIILVDTKITFLYNLVPLLIKFREGIKEKGFFGD